ncbi:hypothetical protein [Paenibacillus puerhi]|uniref:hypothetical protein n=1 Tax=Paenibacillus puerhi TaxID=2692622 RepID=UPI00135AB7B2|nr:hypothetical protein [Paenibacillus puerhi]
MKIALHNELPCEAHVRQLIDALTGPASALQAFEYETLRGSSSRILAAYDRDRLIGLGKWDEGCSEPEFAILPAYRNREIETYMSKLLNAAPRKTAATVCG